MFYHIPLKVILPQHYHLTILYFPRQLSQRQELGLTPQRVARSNALGSCAVASAWRAALQIWDEHQQLELWECRCFFWRGLLTLTSSYTLNKVKEEGFVG